jgi:hypothetical protein
MTSELLNEIGTQEFVSITPKKNKETAKTVGKLVVLECLHPDSPEHIRISKIKMLKGDKLNVTGLWYNTDAEGKIQKGSAIATLLARVGAKNLEELKNKSLETVTESESSRYLVIKAY